MASAKLSDRFQARDVQQVAKMERFLFDSPDRIRMTAALKTSPWAGDLDGERPTLIRPSASSVSFRRWKKPCERASDCSQKWPSLSVCYSVPASSATLERSFSAETTEELVQGAMEQRKLNLGSLPCLPEGDSRAGADLGFFRGRGGWSRGAAFLE